MALFYMSKNDGQLHKVDLHEPQEEPRAVFEEEPPHYEPKSYSFEATVKNTDKLSKLFNELEQAEPQVWVVFRLPNRRKRKAFIRKFFLPFFKGILNLEDERTKKTMWLFFPRFPKYVHVRMGGTYFQYCRALANIKSKCWEIEFDYIHFNNRTLPV